MTTATATATIFVIAILIVAAIAWTTFGRRRRGPDPGTPD
jgi:hypothetical protein